MNDLDIKVNRMEISSASNFEIILRNDGFIEIIDNDAGSILIIHPRDVPLICKWLRQLKKESEEAHRA